MSDMSLETLLASALATGGSGGGGGSYDDTELRRRVTTLEGEVDSIDTQKLDELADIKSIGNGLALDANGELTATGGSGSTDWNNITNKPTDLVQDADYVHTDNNYTTADKDKLAGISNYDDTELQGKVAALESSNAALTASVTTAQGDITNLENTKVDKEDGLGLSQNSFTDTEKTKLANLENYDDTALEARVTANETAIEDRYTKSETDTLLDGYAETVELTQAEYDLLTEAEKKNGKIYFITDGEGGGDGDMFMLIENPSRVFNMTYAELKAMHEAHKHGWFLGSGGNIFPIIGLIYRATPSEHILVITGGGELDRRVITFYPDGSSDYEYTDTGWLTVEAEYIDFKYRKKNGVVYITFSGSIVKKEIPAGNVNIGTLPKECIPTQHIGGALVDRSGACKGFLVARPSGALDAVLTDVIGVSAISTIASGLSYPV